MPFIRGRFHMNPVVGQALEAARDAEAALQALEHSRKSAEDAESDDDPAANDSGDNHGDRTPGPIHRVEIEAAELVPSHSGRAQKGFVARIHRRTHARKGSGAAPAAAGRNQARQTAPDSRSHSIAETHVFTDHRDLTHFLNAQFQKDQDK